MTPNQLAERLNGNQYRKETAQEDIAVAKENNLVIVYGASDDLAEFEGAIYDEASCYNGGVILLDRQGVLPLREDIDSDDDEMLEKFFIRRRTASHIKAIWGDGDYSWRYDTGIPHAAFDILEGNEKYCRGIVFSMNDLIDTSE